MARSEASVPRPLTLGAVIRNEQLELRRVHARLHVEEVFAACVRIAEDAGALDVVQEIREHREMYVSRLGRNRGKLGPGSSERPSRPR